MCFVHLAWAHVLGMGWAATQGAQWAAHAGCTVVLGVDSDETAPLRHHRSIFGKATILASLLSLNKGPLRNRGLAKYGKGVKNQRTRGRGRVSAGGGAAHRGA